MHVPFVAHAEYGDCMLEPRGTESAIVSGGRAMSAGPLDRRTFLCAAAGAAMASSVRATRSEPAAEGRIRLGAPVRVPGDDPEARARAHRAKGYRAAYCPKMPIDYPERLRATETPFA